MKTAVIILAAGDATRMNSRTPKYLHEIGGKPIIDHIVGICGKFNFTKKIIVTNPKFPLERSGWQSVVQKKAKGTGAAVLAAKEALADFDGNVLVLYSDSPFITEETIKNMIAEKNRNDNKIVSLVFEPEDAKHYGRIVLKKDNLIEKIVEFKDASDDEKLITLCNGGNLVCDASLLFSFLKDVGNSNPSGEYWLTDIVAIANKQGYNCALVRGDETEVIGVNTREELAVAESFFQQRKRVEIMANGVTLQSPETTYFSFDTVVGKDSVIEPCVYFLPGAFVPPNSKIVAFSRIGKYAPIKEFYAEPVFSKKMLAVVLFVIAAMFMPFIIWFGADEEKKGLCLQSLEMCVMHAKLDGSNIGVMDCSFGNLKCLLSDIEGDFETLENQSSEIIIEEFENKDLQK